MARSKKIAGSAGTNGRNGHSKRTVLPAREPESRPARGKRSANKPLTISQYLIDRLYSLGIRKMFGIPGDYVLGFYDDLSNSPIEIIGTTREDCAGFAADAYARISGLGALCVTYCVGGLSVVNAVAGAYAEKSPLIVISGSPGLSERGPNVLLHHKVRDFDTQREVFEKITVANTVLNDPLTAFREIDRVIAAVLRYKRPGYIELPRDQADLVPGFPHQPHMPTMQSDKMELAEAVEESAKKLQSSKRPVLLVGVEVHRFGLQDPVIKLAERNQLPICSTLLGKSAISESHPLYVGVYEGAMGLEGPRRLVEESDCVLMIGTFMTDINLGVYTANFDPAKCICATSEDVRISYHHYRGILLEDFVRELSKRTFGCGRREVPTAPAKAREFTPVPKAPVTVVRLFEKINSILTDEMVVICDVGDSLFAAADLRMSRRTGISRPTTRPWVSRFPRLWGQLAPDQEIPPLGVCRRRRLFQMTGMELSTVHRRGLSGVRRAQQQGIHDRAFHQGWPVQRHRELELPQGHGGDRWRVGIRGSYGKRPGKGARRGVGEHRQFQPAQRSLGSLRSQRGDGAFGAPTSRKAETGQRELTAWIARGLTLDIARLGGAFGRSGFGGNRARFDRFFVFIGKNRENPVPRVRRRVRAEHRAIDEPCDRKEQLEPLFSPADAIWIPFRLELRYHLFAMLV
ncbi:MAG: thiamine pyrophosphate-binding protein [Planctomycetota bacterium]